jgi:hypothetical protein
LLAGADDLADVGVVEEEGELYEEGAELLE